MTARGQIDFNTDRVRRAVEKFQANGIYDKRESPPIKGVVHITGTNGKGSAAEMIFTGLAKMNLAVSVFTTPHLVNATESIRYAHDGNVHEISRSEFDETRSRVLALYISPDGRAMKPHSKGPCDSKDPCDTPLTEGELLFLTHLLFNHKIGVEYLVVEVGMGGKRDATNIFDMLAVEKRVCVITSIGMDHVEFLGDTPEKIAFEKAGIVVVQESTCLHSASIEKGPESVIRHHCKAVGAHAVRIQPEQQHMDNAPFNGMHQPQNFALAIEAIQSVLPQRVAESCLIENMKQSVIRGRLHTEMCRRLEHQVLVDGGHNSQAVSELKRWLDWLDQETGAFPPLNRIFVCAASQNRVEIFNGLFRHDDIVIFTKFGKVEGMPWIKSVNPQTLLERYRETVNQEMSSTNNLEEALSLVKSQLRNNQGLYRVIVCGSFYLAGEYYRLEEG